MVLYIRLLSHDAEDFVMELAVDSTAAFMTLHIFIQNSLGYDPSNMASFVITDNDWNRLKEISLMKMNEEDEGVELMADTRIGDLLSDVKQRALYVFDFFSERAFFIEVFDIKPGELKEPMLIKLEGKIPSQINIDDNLVDDDLDDILDDDEFGEGFEDIDDIDPDSIPDGY
jgi:hypothetical protein